MKRFFLERASELRRRRALKGLIFVEVVSIIIVILTFVIYMEVFHEFSHYAVCLLSGFWGKMTLGFPAKTECPGIETNTLMFSLYKMAPYLFLALPISIFFSIHRCETRNGYVNMFLASLPLVAIMDTLINYFIAFDPRNDFYGLLAIDPVLFAVATLTVVAVVLTSPFWMRNSRVIFRKAIKRKRKEMWI